MQMRTRTSKLRSCMTECEESINIAVCVLMAVLVEDPGFSAQTHGGNHNKYK